MPILIRVVTSAFLAVSIGFTLATILEINYTTTVPVYILFTSKSKQYTSCYNAFSFLFNDRISISSILENSRTGRVG